MVHYKGRVVRIVSDLPYGGVERRLLTLLPLLREAGWDASVACIRVAGEMAPLFEAQGIPVEVLPFSSRWSPSSLRRLARRFREMRVDVVHTHMYRCNTSGVVAAKLAGVPLVVANVHNVDEWDDRRQLFMERRLARLKDIIIAVSERVRQNYLQRTGISPTRVVTLHNGIDLSPFGPHASNPHLRSELGIKAGEKVVSIIARLVQQKRHTDFLEMAAQVRDRVPQARFIVVGQGKLRSELERRAAELGLGDRVVFTGHRNDIPALLAMTDVFVMCSEREGFSNALLEAMASGAPIVSTDAGGASEAVVDGESGFILPIGRPDLVAERVTSLLADANLSRRVRLAARERVSLFSVDRMCQATDLLYEKMLGR